MPAIDRTAALSVLYPGKRAADEKLTFYRTQPYPAMLAIAEDRAYTLDLLIEAIDNGLLERLVAEQAEADELAEARAQVEQATANAPAVDLSQTPLAQAFGAIPLPRDGKQTDGGDV